MNNLKNFITETLKTDTISEVGYDLILAGFQSTPLSLCSVFTKENSPSSIRDRIFMECLRNFLLNIYKYDKEKKQFVESNITALSVILAKASPNYESGYEGNPEVLREYAVRIVKMIDECGTIQKSEYLANLTRAVINGLIDTNKYFKLCRCVLNLTEEDLNFLRQNIKSNVISVDEEYIDDFISVGILYAVDGGYTYSKRAFDLKQYALNYNHEEDVGRPNKFLERWNPVIIEDANDVEF